MCFMGLGDCVIDCAVFVLFVVCVLVVVLLIAVLFVLVVLVVFVVETLIGQQLFYCFVYHNSNIICLIGLY